VAAKTLISLLLSSGALYGHDVRLESINNQQSMPSVEITPIKSPVFRISVSVNQLLIFIREPYK
jgi:hypothetical protein